MKLKWSLLGKSPGKRRQNEADYYDLILLHFLVTLIFASTKKTLYLCCSCSFNSETMPSITCQNATAGTKRLIIWTKIPGRIFLLNIFPLPIRLKSWAWRIKACFFNRVTVHHLTLPCNVWKASSCVQSHRQVRLHSTHRWTTNLGNADTVQNTLSSCSSLSLHWIC